MRSRIEQGIKAKSVTKGTVNSMLGLPSLGDERDDEMAGDPSAVEREMKDKELEIASRKNEIQSQGQQRNDNGLPAEGDDGAPPRPVNTNGRGALGGSMRATQLNGREEILRAFHDDQPRNKEGEWTDGGGSSSSGGSKKDDGLGIKPDAKIRPSLLPKNHKKWSIDQVNAAFEDLGIKRVPKSEQQKFHEGRVEISEELEFPDGTKKRMTGKEVKEFLKKYLPNGKVKKAFVTNGVHRNGSVLKAQFSEVDHPRDDNGQFVSKDEMNAAKDDPEKAKELLSRVTDPEQRAKLEKELGQSPESSEGKPTGEKDKIENDSLDPADEQILSDGTSNDGLHSALELLNTENGNYDTIGEKDLDSLKEQLRTAIVSDTKGYADVLRKYGADKEIARADRKAAGEMKAIEATIDRTTAKVEQIDQQIAEVQRELLTEDTDSFDFEEWADEKIPPLSEEEFFAKHLPEEPYAREFLPKDSELDEPEEGTPEYEEYEKAQAEWNATQERLEEEFERLNENRSSEVNKLAEKERKRNERANDKIYDLKGKKEGVVASMEEKISERYNNITSEYSSIYFDSGVFDRYFPAKETQQKQTS